MLGPSVGYIELLDHYTQERTEKDASSGRKWMPLRPSSAGKCERELAYEMMEYRGFASYPKEKQDAETTRLLNLGHGIEYHLLKQLESVEAFKVSYKQQVLSFFRISPTELIEGSIDGVFLSEKHKCVFDVKSKKDKFHSWFKTDWEGTDAKLAEMRSVQAFGPSCYWVEDLDAFLAELNDVWFEANFLQLNLYFFDEGAFLRNRGIDHAVILQYNKNNSALREIRFKPSEGVYNRVKEKFLRVANLVDTDKSPEKANRDFAFSSMKCAFCNFKETCRPDQGDALKAYFRTWPKKEWPVDTSKLKDKQEIESWYASFCSGVDAEKQRQEAEDTILKIMEEEQVQKVRFSDGAIYEMKYLKSPKPHFELRRTKL